jgi:hypothetical protein
VSSSPLWGLNFELLYPRLAPWAGFLRRAAALKVKGVGQECPTHTAKVKSRGRGARATRSFSHLRPNSAAFFGVSFDQLFGEDYQAEDLGPFGDYVAGDLSPLGIGVVSGEERDPAYAGDH